MGYSFCMIRLEAAEQLLSEMSRAEKAQVLQWVVRDLGEAFPGIESRPDVCGGEPCIVRTRIPVWLLVKARQLGTSEADLLRCYPGLRAEDLVNAWAYARAHTEEIEQQTRENGAAHLVPTREDALKALRGSGRGERLVERLLQSRREEREVGESTPE